MTKLETVKVKDIGDGVATATIGFLTEDKMCSEIGEIQSNNNKEWAV